MAEAARAREAERRAEARAREATRAEQAQAHFKYAQAIQELRALEDSLKAERARQQVFFFSFQVRASDTGAAGARREL